MEEEIKSFIGFISEPIDDVSVRSYTLEEANYRYKLRAQVDILDNRQQFIRTDFRDLPTPNNYSEEEALALQRCLNNEKQNLLEILKNIPNDNDDEYWNTILSFPKNMQLIHQQ